MCENLLCQRQSTEKKKEDLLAHNVLGHLRDLTPLVFRKVKAARHNLLPHVLWDGAAVMLGVERWVAAQHYVDYHTKRPQVTALQTEKQHLRKLFTIEAGSRHLQQETQI